MTRYAYAVQRWSIFAIVSAIFFHVTGSTFTSLGVALPFMIEELGWSWTNAGLGFTLLALLTGLASMVPAWAIRHFGIRVNYAIGGAIMAVGFALMAMTAGLRHYFVGASLLGIGFAMCATVPAVHVLNNWMPERRSLAIGAFMTIGALGGVAGPLVVTGVVSLTGSWRTYWWLMAASILGLTLLALLFVRSAPDRPGEDVAEDGASREKHSDKVFQTDVSWRFRDVLWSPQYYIIVIAMTSVLFCAVTMNTWAVTHMGTLGISTTIAAAALSAHSMINALSRIFGGMLATRIDPKWLLVSALVAEIVGMVALAGADNMVAITLFAIGEGYAFGMCYFATIMLLVNYYGPDDNPEILGTLNLITTAAMLGPVLAGFVGDTVGSFAIVFQVYAFLVLLILIATVMMKPPRPKDANAKRLASTAGSPPGVQSASAATRGFSSEGPSSRMN